MKRIGKPCSSLLPGMRLIACVGRSTVKYIVLFVTIRITRSHNNIAKRTVGQTISARIALSRPPSIGAVSPAHCAFSGTLMLVVRGRHWTFASECMPASFNVGFGPGFCMCCLFLSLLCFRPSAQLPFSYWRSSRSESQCSCECHRCLSHPRVVSPSAARDVCMCVLVHTIWCSFAFAFAFLVL
jgi:hypothetical protein